MPQLNDIDSEDEDGPDEMMDLVDSENEGPIDDDEENA